MANTILSTKAVQLSSPGTKYSDLYYTNMNSSVEMIDSTCNWQNKINLTSLTFGSNNQVNMPLSSFLGTLILRLRLPPVIANQTLTRGWGLRMIRQLRFQLGSSTSTPIVMQQQAIWHTLMAACETREKRSQMLQLCGEGISAAQAATGSPAQPAINEAFVPIPLPFSTICEKLMFDSTLLGQPITVFIDFEQSASAIYGGTGTQPSAFLAAELMVRQQILVDASKSLRNIMMADPAYHYNYPFILSIGYPVPGQFAGARPVDGLCTVQFNQFQNSDLLLIAVSVQKVTDYSPVIPNSPNPFHCDPISNITVTYNGSSLFELPGQSYKAISTYMGNQQASGYDGSYVVAGGTNPFDVRSVDENIVLLDFTLLRSACMGSHLYNTTRIPPGSVLMMSFNTSEGASSQYTCYYTCFYNAMIDVVAGTSNIITS